MDTSNSSGSTPKLSVRRQCINSCQFECFLTSPRTPRDCITQEHWLTTPYCNYVKLSFWYIILTVCNACLHTINALDIKRVDDWSSRLQTQIIYLHRFHEYHAHDYHGMRVYCPFHCHRLRGYGTPTAGRGKTPWFSSLIGSS